jgi:hypothetical protein
LQLEAPLLSPLPAGQESWLSGCMIVSLWLGLSTIIDWFK